MPEEMTKRKKIIEYILLLFAPAMLLGSFLVQLIAGETGMLELYGWNTLVIEFLIILVPATIFIMKNGGFERFGFERISAREWLFSMALGIGVFFITTGINAITSAILYLFDLPFAGSEMPSGGGAVILLSLLYVAVAPAVAEETLFRGAIMRSWLPFNAKAAVFHAAMLFALVHFQIAALPALLFAGLVFSYVSWLSGSVYTSMAMHFSYNASAVLLSAALSPIMDQTQTNAGNAMDQIRGVMDAGGASAMLFLAGIITAAAFYFGTGFLIGHPSYRALVRACAKRKGIYADEFKAVRAGLQAAHCTGEKQKVLNWRIACAYILLILVGLSAFALELLL